MNSEESATSAHAASAYSKIIAAHRDSTNQQSLKAQELAARFRDSLEELSKQGAIMRDLHDHRNRSHEHSENKDTSDTEIGREQAHSARKRTVQALEIGKNLAAGGNRRSEALPSRYQVRTILQRG